MISHKQVAIPEALMFRGSPKLTLGSSNRDLPLRSLSSVCIKDSSGKFVGLENIESDGPFTAIGIYNYEYGLVIENEKLLVLENITEYSLEYPYGTKAIIWLKTFRAHYSVTSLDPEYEQSGKAGLFRDASVCGHVINAFINIKGDKTFARVMLKAHWLSKMSLKQFFSVILEKRRFLLDQFSQQDLKHFSQTRVYRILNDDELWTKSRMTELIFLVEREAVRQEKKHDLASSDEDDSVKNGTQISLEIIKKRPLPGVEEVKVKKKKESVENKENIFAENHKEIRKAFVLAPCGYKDETIEIPNELALSYPCPFCPLVLRRVVEHISIVDLTIDHFQHHLYYSRLQIPVNKSNCFVWPSLSFTCFPEIFIPKIKFPFLPPGYAPLTIVDVHK